MKAILLLGSLTYLSIWRDSPVLAQIQLELSQYDGGYEGRLIEPLSEITSGALRGHPFTLIMPEELKASVAEEFVTFLGVPLSILYLPKELPSLAGVEANFTRDLGESSATNFGSYDTESGNSFYFPIKTRLAVVILPGTGSTWWPLWKPLDHWMTDAILLVSLTSCGISVSLHEAPLLEKTSSAALLCSNKRPQGVGPQAPAKLMTWLPFRREGQLKLLGDWSPMSFHSWNDFFIDRFQDMSLKNISIYAVQDDTPLVYKGDDGTPRGMNIQIVQALCKWLGFQLIVDLTGGETWEALGELVKEGKRDVMINFSANTPQRYRDFDLTVAYHFEGFGLVLEVPRPLPRWQNLLLPFTGFVWIIIVASFIITSAVYYLLYYQFDKSIAENIFLVTQDLMTDPSGASPTPWKIRNFLLMWWIFSWIIQLCWICNLIAVLTIPIFPKKIQTKEELAKSKYRLCMLDYGEFVPEALRTSTESTLATLGSKLDLVPLMMEWKEFGHEGCVDRVVAGTHAQTETYSYIKLVYVRLGHTGRTYMLRDELYPSYLSFRLRKHTAWKHKFDYGIQRLYETGLVQLWLRRAMDEFTDKSAQETSSGGQAPLTLEHLQGSFLFLSLGLFASLLIMAGEVLSSPRK